jgi:hypothetical protein
VGRVGSPSARAVACSADRCAAYAALATARLYGQAQRRDAASMQRYGDHVALHAHETIYGPVVTSEQYKMRLAFQGRQARRGPRP